MAVRVLLSAQFLQKNRLRRERRGAELTTIVFADGRGMVRCKNTVPNVRCDFPCCVIERRCMLSDMTESETHHKSLLLYLIGF